MVEQVCYRQYIQLNRMFTGLSQYKFFIRECNQVLPHSMNGSQVMDLLCPGVVEITDRVQIEKNRALSGKKPIFLACFVD